ncbi:hypothetical protein [Herbidospora sp. RD11066]
MPEAVISYAGEMPLQPGGIKDLHPFVPCLEAKIGDEPLFTVWIQLSGQGGFIAGNRLEQQGFSRDEAREALDRALIRYGTHRLELLVTEWLETGAEVNSGHVWELTAEEVPQLLELLRDKKCGYQVRSQRDLFCTAASDHDETAVGTIDGRRAAPTSKPICENCGLPDTDYVCSHLMHTEVVGIRTLPGLVGRQVIGALCDQGRDEVKQFGRCHAGGNECWQRLVEVEEPAIPAVSPLELAEAFDVLDAVWRLAFDKRKPLLSLSTVTTPAALSLGCATRAEFETRISDLADLIDRIKVDDTRLRPGTDKANEIKGSLDALTNCLHHHLDTAQYPAVDKAIRTLRTIRQARNAVQHGITDGGGLTARLRDLGIHDAPPNWSGAWDVVRARAVGALTGLRHELMMYINKP